MVGAARRPVRSCSPAAGCARGIALVIPWARQSLLNWAATTLVVGAAGFGLGLLTIRYLEITEPDDVPRVEPDTEEVESQEDHQVQNQFTMLTPIRNSWARRFAMTVMLWSGNLLSEHLWNRGKLVAVGTIDFARMYRLSTAGTCCSCRTTTAAGAATWETSSPWAPLRSCRSGPT